MSMFFQTEDEAEDYGELSGHDVGHDLSARWVHDRSLGIQTLWLFICSALLKGVSSGEIPPTNGHARESRLVWQGRS